MATGWLALIGKANLLEDQLTYISCISVFCEKEDMFRSTHHMSKAIRMMPTEFMDQRMNILLFNVLKLCVICYMYHEIHQKL